MERSRASTPSTMKIDQSRGREDVRVGPSKEISPTRPPKKRGLRMDCQGRRQLERKAFGRNARACSRDAISEAQISMDATVPVLAASGACPAEEAARASRRAKYSVVRCGHDPSSG